MPLSRTLVNRISRYAERQGLLERDAGNTCLTSNNIELMTQAGVWCRHRDLCNLWDSANHRLTEPVYCRQERPRDH